MSKRNLLSSANALLRRNILLFKKEDGTALIEFAILAPIFIMLILGIINIGIMMVIQNALDAAVREAARYGITGQSQTGLTRSQSILQVIQQVSNTYSAGIINSNNLQVTVTAFTDLTETGSGVTSSFGLPGQAVLYQVSYPWNTFVNLFGFGNIMTLSAQTPVVNEEFTSNP